MDLTQLTQALSNTLHPELRAQAEAQLEQVNMCTHTPSFVTIEAPHRYTKLTSLQIIFYKLY